MRLLSRALRCALPAAAAAAVLSAHAQSVVLSPAVVPLAGSLGQSTTQVLTLRNDTDQALDFVLDANDVVVREGARAFVPAGQLADSIAASAVFTPKRVHVEPHASGSVSATFTLPPQMRHRAVVAFFRGTNTVRAGGRPAQISLGTLFTFTVSKDISVRAGAFAASPPGASANAQLKATLVNDGQEPVVPTGMAVILDATGALVGKVPFPAHRLLPGESGTIVADYAGELAPGNYRAIATFDVAGHPLTLTSALDVR
jgi:hypothetical protein